MIAGAHAGVRYSLYAPGERKANRRFLCRLRHNGSQLEFMTDSQTETGAHAYATRFIDTLEARTEVGKRTNPQAEALGEFEIWLLETHRLDGESVIGPGFRPLSFWKVHGGYMGTRIVYRNFIKNVLEHRLKFLLAHRWLPRSIDHVNRVRHDNRIDNLRPATAAQQTHNRSRNVRGDDPGPWGSVA